MFAGSLALAIAAFFFGAALYINIAEQPARLELSHGEMLEQWKFASSRGFMLQAPLCVLGCVCGLVALWQTGNWRWIVGAILLIANVPYTIRFIVPINNQLASTAAADAGPQTRALVERWGHLHAIRSLLGLGATLCNLWASVG